MHKHLILVLSLITQLTPDFSFDDIRFWVGEGENQAALLVDWYYEDETALVWGYRWDGEATGLDMINAIAEADPNFLLLSQTTSLGNTLAGIGYAEPRNQIKLAYDLQGASADSRILFGYDVPNTFLGQTHSPENALDEVEEAIKAGMERGIIDHPLNLINYGYACYDYDYWYSSNPGVKWRSAWYDGYWSYLVKDAHSEEFNYSGIGASQRPLSNGSCDAWTFQDGWESWEGIDPREPYTAALPPETTSIEIEKPDIISAGCEIRIYDMAGCIIDVYINKNDSPTIDLSSYPNGIYIVKAGDKTRKVIKL